jgi:hypothetical protein
MMPISLRHSWLHGLTRSCKISLYAELAINTDSP